MGLFRRNEHRRRFATGKLDALLFKENGDIERICVDATVMNAENLLGAKHVCTRIRTIGGKRFALIMDRDGILNDRVPVALRYDEDGELSELLSGPVIVTGCADGGPVSLSEDETAALCRMEREKMYFKGTVPCNVFSYS